MSRNKQLEWDRLDNAAKIFPCSTNKQDTKVFRFICELKSPIDEVVLQNALDDTLDDFPFYRSVLKNGFFWYYLERSSLKAKAHKENNPPCSTLFDKNSRNLLFDVTYFENRINLEVFHALSDGSGAMQFLKALVCKYLILKYPNDFNGHALNIDYGASSSQKSEDSFQKYYVPKHKKLNRKERAYQIRGLKVSEYRLSVIEGTTSTRQLLDITRQNGTTITVFLASILVSAIGNEMAVRNRNKPVVLNIPVNLRSFFKSETARNFFGVINTKYNFSKSGFEIESIQKVIAESFKSQLSQEILIEKISEYLEIEHNPIARVTPLPIKDFLMRIASRMALKNNTCTLSNIGRITMPKETIKYIEKFSVFNSTERLGLWICSFEDKLSINFTSAFRSTEIQKNFFRILSKLGINTVIANNIID